MAYCSLIGVYFVIVVHKTMLLFTIDRELDLMDKAISVSSLLVIQMNSTHSVQNFKNQAVIQRENISVIFVLCGF